MTQSCQVYFQYIYMASVCPFVPGVHVGITLTILFSSCFFLYMVRASRISHLCDRRCSLLVFCYFVGFHVVLMLGRVQREPLYHIWKIISFKWIFTFHVGWECPYTLKCMSVLDKYIHIKVRAGCNYQIRIPVMFRIQFCGHLDGKSKYNNIPTGDILLC